MSKRRWQVLFWRHPWMQFGGFCWNDSGDVGIVVWFWTWMLRVEWTRGN